MEFPGECYETSAEFPCASINSWPDAHIHVVWHGRAEGGEFTLLTLLEIILQIISSIEQVNLCFFFWFGSHLHN